MAEVTPTKISLYQLRLLHKTKDILGKTRVDTEPIDAEHYQANLLLLQAYDLFNKVADRYPLPNKQEVKTGSPKQMATPVVTWQSDDVADPALLDPLFDDCGLGRDDTLHSERPEQKELAREAAKNYFIDFIRQLGEGHSLTMGELNTMGYVFYDAYLAGMAKKVHPQQS